MFRAHLRRLPSTYDPEKWDRQIRRLPQKRATRGAAARRLKWEWIQHSIEAPGAADKIRLYDSYLHKMEKALQGSDWLVENKFSIADIAMTPHANRIAALSMEGLWSNGRLPRTEAWFDRIQERPTFEHALVKWMPAVLATEMRENGRRSWPQIQQLLHIDRDSPTRDISRLLVLLA
jgi:glutathione S-transferase